MANLHSHSLVQDFAAAADVAVAVAAAVGDGAAVVAAADAVVGEDGGGEEDDGVGVYELVDFAVAAGAVDEGECWGPAREDQSEVLPLPLAHIEVPGHSKGHRDPLVGPHIEATHPCVHNLLGKKHYCILFTLYRTD